MGKTDTLDEELVVGLKAAKTKRCSFALVVKGAADGALIISKQKIPPVLITAAKKKCGGSSVIKGAVFYEDGKYIFETGKPPAATLPAALKLIAKRDAGMTIVAICRVGTDPDLFEDGDGASAPAAVATPVAAKTGAKGSVPAAKTKAGDAPAANLETAYQARVKALTDNLKKAIITRTPAGNEAKLRFSESQLYAGKKDFAQAMPLLGVVEDEIKKALAGTTGAKGSDPAAKATAGDDPAAKLEAAYQARVKTLTDDLKKAITTGTPAGNEAKLRFKESQVHSGKKHFGLAMDLLDLAEDQIKLALGGTASAGVSAEAFRAFQTRWKPIREEWQEASDTVDGQIGQLQKALLQKNDPELKQIAEFGLNSLTGDFNVPLLAALQELDGAKPENLQPRAAKLRAIATAFQAHLSTDAKDKVMVCDRNPYGVKITIRKLLVPALAELQTMLATAGAG